MFLYQTVELILRTLILVYLVVKWSHWIEFAKKINKIPGEKGYPIIGIVWDYYTMTPDELFIEMRKYLSQFEGICRAWLTLLPVVVIYSPEILECILTQTIHNRKGYIYLPFIPWLKEGLLTSSGEKWHSRRKLLTSAFHFNILQSYLKVFNLKSNCFIKNLKESGAEEINVTTAVTKFTLDSICETAMGISLSDSKDGEKYRSAVNEFTEIVTERCTKVWLLLSWIYVFTKTYFLQRKIINILHTFSREVIKKRKTNFRDVRFNDNAPVNGSKKLAMLDLLLSAQQSNKQLGDEDIREEVDTFIFEGHDTTSASVTTTLMLLANNRQYQDKIYDEIIAVFNGEDRDPTYNDIQELKYMEMCIKESLRLYPSVPLVSRKAGEDIKTTNGLVIPQDTQIIISIYDLHRRADIYPNPDKFDPDRFLPENCNGRHPCAYIPFSVGTRNCIGQKFAMMEMKCLITAILRNYILEPIDKPEDIRLMLNPIIRTKDDIRVKFIPRF